MDHGDGKGFGNVKSSLTVFASFCVDGIRFGGGRGRGGFGVQEGTVTMPVEGSGFVAANRGCNNDRLFIRGFQRCVNLNSPRPSAANL